MGFNVNETMLASRWLAKTDLDYQGKNVTITNISQEVMPDQSQKFAVHFSEVKPLLLNKVNARVLAAMFGGNTDGWIGKKVCVFNDPTVNYQGATGAVRVRPPVSQVKPSAELDSDVPF